ncbi:MAG: universal stress protein [Candidatus Omnitrophica bacterium]|jgi:nucleotide-binding universal stress UspA family protein|nr:universal stress protein [Candidatus Omnitrophota bacterium]
MAKILNIAVSLSGSAASLITAKYAIYLSRQLNAKLYAIYVVDARSLHELLKTRIFVEIEAVEYERDLKDQGVNVIERVRKMAEIKKVEYEGLLLNGVVHEEVVNKVRELSAGLLVIGELKEIVSRREIFYDEGERIFRESPCPVVVVKNPEEVERLYKEVEQ